MTSTLCDVEAVFSRMSNKTAREASSISALLRYLIIMLERERAVAVD